jgi:hypothetical protein
MGLEGEVENSESKNRFHYWFQPFGEKIRIKEPLLVLGIPGTGNSLILLEGERGYTQNRWLLK